MELRFAPISHGTHAGQRGIEALLDGRRVGELTLLMSQRYAPLVDGVLRGGGRPGCVGLVVHGRRGLEVELRLPEVTAGAPVPHPGPPTRPVPNGPPPGAPGGRPSRKPLWIGAGVVALLVVIGANVGRGGDPTDMASSGPAASTSTSPPADSAPTSSPAATSSPAPSSSSAPASAAAPAGLDTEAVPNGRAPVGPAAVLTTTARRAPTTAPSQPAPKPAPEPAPASDCDPNYGGCVPIASDVDCAGGSGNGPAYVRGPVRVIGDDIYGLDADDDGTGCDS